MKRKIVGILVCMLLIAATVLPVAGTINKNEAKSSSGQLPQLDVGVDELSLTDQPYSPIDTTQSIDDIVRNHGTAIIDEDETLSCKLVNEMGSCAMWTPQFMYDVGGLSGSLYLVGVGFDGNYFYCTEFNGPTIYRFKNDGTPDGSFTIPGVSSLLDLAYDGTYFYGATYGNPNIINKMSFNPPAYISQITAPDVAWNIAYDANADSGNGGFWIGQWDYHLTLIDRLGNPLHSITPPESMLGIAWDNVCGITGYAGPFLWIFTGTSTGVDGIIKCIDLATDTLIPGLEHNVAAEFGQGIAGGLEFTTEWDVAGGTATLYGIVQGDGPPDDYLFGYEMCDICGADTTPPDTVHTFNPATPDGSNNWYISCVEVTLDATDDLSGVATTEYRLDSGTPDVYTDPFDVCDCTHQIEYRSIDYCGNEEGWKAFDLKIDTTPPTISLTRTIVIPGVLVKYTATVADACSGVDRVEWTRNGNPVSPINPLVYRTTPVGLIFVTAIVYDVAGNPNIAAMGITNIPSNQGVSQNIQKSCQQSKNLLFSQISQRLMNIK